MSVTPQKFCNKLIVWYLENKRELPWRSTNQPYFIWLSEIILQQTKVDQGMPYYLKFVDEFPTVQDLANASEERILKLWQGLGYYSRAINLHHTAKYISKELNGHFPKTYKELIHLKGVGDYTASAIASICYREPTAVVDGNVYRVLARVFGIDLKINESKGIRYFKEVAQKLIDKDDPGTYNQSIMEFGAKFCVPNNPNCSNCILNDNCVAFNTNKVANLPVKTKKIDIKKIYYNYIIILSADDKTLLKKRTNKGIWYQLYEFPLIETDKELSISNLKKLKAYREISEAYAFISIRPFQKETIVHKLSHRHIHTRFWVAESKRTLDHGIPINELKNFPVPTLIDNFFSSFFYSEVRM